MTNRRLSGFEVPGISSCRLRGCHTSVFANFEIDGRVPLTIAAGENHALAKVKSSPEGFECLPFLRCSPREWHCSWSRNQSGRWRHHYTGHERGYIDVPGIPVPHVLMHPSSPHLVSRFPTLCNSAWAVYWPGWFLVRVHAESAAAVRIFVKYSWWQVHKRKPQYEWLRVYDIGERRSEHGSICVLAYDGDCQSVSSTVSYSKPSGLTPTNL